MVIPSMPDAPLLLFTRASAFFRLARSTIVSIDGPTAARLSISVFAARASVPSAPALGARDRRSTRHSTVRAFGGSPRLLCPLLTSPPRSRALRPAQSEFPDTPEISQGKTDRLRRTPAGFTTPVLDGRGLRDHLLARPTG